MRDTCKQLRLSVFNCLNGNLNGRNIYDEKKKVGATDTMFVILSTQQESPIQDNDSTWISTSSIDIEIIAKTDSETSKDDIDELANLILSLVFPTRSTCALIAPSNLEFQNAVCSRTITRNISLSETESILSKIITFTTTIVQQL